MNMNQTELNKLNKDVVTRFELLTPEEMLALDEATAKAKEAGLVVQRGQSQGVIQKYARDIINGDWMLNPQTITVTTQGYVIDGWHRVKAGIQSGRSVVFNVTRGWPDKNTFKVLDSGRPRTVNQILTLTGATYVTRRAAIARTIAQAIVQNGQFSKGQLSVAEVARILNLFTKSVEAILEVSRRAPTRGNPSEVLACIVFVHDKLPDSVYEFAEDFYGMNFSEGHPARALRRFLDRQGRKYKGSTVAYTMNAIHAYVEKRNVNILTDKQDGLQWARKLQTGKLADVRAIVGM
jgi:hypothetical protein